MSELKDFTDDELSVELAGRFLKPGRVMKTLVETVRKLRGDVFCILRPLKDEELIRALKLFGYATPLRREQWSEFVGNLTALQAENAYLKSDRQGEEKARQVHALIGEIAGINQQIQNIAVNTKDNLSPEDRTLIASFRDEIHQFSLILENLR